MQIEEFIKGVLKEYNLDCYIVFNSDSHLNEYIGEKDMRVFQLSGFNGSNGTVIYSKEPCLITDSRYFIAAKQQSKFPLFKGKASEYLVEKGYKRVSFDTKTISSSQFKDLSKTFKENSMEFIDCAISWDAVDSAASQRIANELIDQEKIFLKDFLFYKNSNKVVDYLNSLGFDIERVLGLASGITETVDEKSKLETKGQVPNGLCNKGLIYAKQEIVDEKSKLETKGQVPNILVYTKHEAMNMKNDKLSNEIVSTVDMKCRLETKDNENVEYTIHDNSKITTELGTGASKHYQNVTGSCYKDKIKQVRKIIGKKTLIITELDTIAWILNLRGFDIEYNPLFYSYFIINEYKAILFTDKMIDREGVEVKPYNSFENYITSLGDAGPNNAMAIVSNDCNQFIFSKFSSIEYTKEIRKLQASKNEAELVGMILSYFYDGIALTELFAFIQNNDSFTEIDLANKLEEIKREFNGFVGPSFETISSTGSNAAIVHHRPSNRIVDKSQVYLIDSGSHYYFGTTDTTRTLFFGSIDPLDESMNTRDGSVDTHPTGDKSMNAHTSGDTSMSGLQELMHDYTLVLKGQLNAMMKTYTKDNNYSDIDFISRKYLKEENKDFGHSTGHGVGHFLCVHEHPPTVYPKGDMNHIEVNQVFSVEPGYYKEDHYGIRIENLVISRLIDSNTCCDGDGNECDGKKNSDQCNGCVGLLNITTVPYQRAMVDATMLNQREKDYYNKSNKICFDLLKDFVSKEAYSFLKESAKPICIINK